MATRVGACGTKAKWPWLSTKRSLRLTTQNDKVALFLQIKTASGLCFWMHSEVYENCSVEL